MSYVTAQYLAQIGWWDYVASKATDSAVEQAIRIRADGRPSMGDWVALLGAVADREFGHRVLTIGYRQRRDDLGPVAVLVQGWKYVDAEIARGARHERLVGGAEDELRAGSAPRAKLEDFFQTVLRCRNALAHAVENGFPDEDDVLRMLNGWLLPALYRVQLDDALGRVLTSHAQVRSEQRAQRVAGGFERSVVALLGELKWVTLRSREDFDDGSYLARLEPDRSATLLFPFLYDARAWPRAPTPTEAPGGPGRADAVALYAEVVELAMEGGLTFTERSRLERIRDRLALAPDDVAEVHERYGIGAAPVPLPQDLVAVVDEVRRGLDLLAVVPDRVVAPESSRPCFGEPTIGIEVARGGAVSLLFRDPPAPRAFLAWQGVDVPAASAAWPGWVAAPGAELSRSAEGDPPSLAREILAALVALTSEVAGRGGARAAPDPDPLERAALLVGLDRGTLERGVTAYAGRAVVKDWAALLGPLGAACDPQLVTRRHGRIGLDLVTRSDLHVFVGVVVAPDEHGAAPTRPALGADLVVLVEGSGAPIDRRAAIEQEGAGWQVRVGPSRVELARPLAPVLANGSGPDDRYRAWRDALFEGVGALGRADAWLPSAEAPMALEATWPEAGRRLAKAVLERVLPLLPFELARDPYDVDFDAVGVDGEAVVLYPTEAQGIEVWFTSRRRDRISVVLGFYSVHERRDPVYRAARERLLDGSPDRKLALRGNWSLSEPEWTTLGLEGVRRMTIAELDDPKLVDDLAEGTLDLAARLVDALDGVRARRARRRR